jgi:peptidylprolyl isomerase
MHTRLIGTFGLGAMVLAGLSFACGDGPDPTPVPTSAPTKAATLAPLPAGTVSPALFDVTKATTTASGLKYIDTVVGTGASPGSTQTVTVNYTGKLAANGSVFDTTTGKQPISFQMNGVIKGFSEGLSTMKVGGKRTVFIPSAIGYGAAGNPPTIPGNADLIFDIELVAIK